MTKLITALFLLIGYTSFAQNSFKAIISGRNEEVLSGAGISIITLKITAATDSSGYIILNNIPDGAFEIECSYVGYEEKNILLKFPLINENEILKIALEPSESELGEVMVSTTRSSRSMDDLPTRVEAITPEELDEKTTMKPGDIKMLLNESTGIATQQTSAVSGTANIRIQGLDGKYTQILKDGMPLYNGFAGGLSIMQIAPLDLKQVEFIKGSASTLYGGGAIAGLVNLISKTPQQKRELSFLLNATTAKGFDASSFYSQKFKKIGTTIFTSYNFNGAYDRANIGFTSIPKTNRFTINPKIFFYPNKNTTGYFGINTTYENRYGGDVHVIEGKADSIHKYFEKNISLRTSTQLNIEHTINDRSKIQFKNSIGFFNRKLLRPEINFQGNEVSSFSEMNYSYHQQKSEWIAGVNLGTDNFSQKNPRPDSSNFYYHLTTLGVFAQNNFKANDWFSLESGFRIDYNSPATNDKGKGFVFLPRINALFKINKQLTSRIGGGFGYKMPSPFSEDAEEKGYANIQPISFSNTQAEKSYGGNADVNFKTYFDEIYFSINQLFFYTYLNKPLVLQQNNFVNANGYINTKGAETNVRITKGNINFYAGYTYTDTKQHFNGQSTWQPLSPKHRLNADITYEKENSLRAGIESFYVSEQQLSDGSTGKGFITFGFLFQKMWKHFSAYINVENLTDRRQTRWDTIYTGTIANPIFKDIYTPLDGAVFNAGVKIKL